MELEYLKGYLNLRQLWPDKEDLAALLEIVQEAIFLRCPVAKQHLRESCDEQFRIRRVHHADGHLLADMEYRGFGVIPAYLGEACRSYGYQKSHISLDIHK